MSKLFSSTLFSTGGDEVNIKCYTDDVQTQQALNASGKTLEQALDEKYDVYFAGLQRFGYQGCRIGYFEDGQAEFPKWEAGMRYSD